MFDQPVIRVQGARQHNLKGFDLEIPRNKLVVITGVSGSGKSSLAFDTIYAEGQRRYVESLSAYARQFLDQLEKPDVDFIEGLTPAIAIEQRTTASNPRSTIATTTEIYDYLRILYAALGQPHDPDTGVPLVRHTVEDVVQLVESFPERTRLMIGVPVPVPAGQSLEETLERYQNLGFLRVRIDGEVYDVDDRSSLPSRAMELEVIVDRLIVKEDMRSRIADSLETGKTLSEAAAALFVCTPDSDNWERVDFTFEYTNPETGFHLPKLTPKHFSFNSHLGACDVCQGLGTELKPDPSLIVPDSSKSLAEGAVKTWWTGSKSKKGYHQRAIEDLGKSFGVNMSAPVKDLPNEFKRSLIYGNDSFEGLAPQALRLLETSKSEVTKRNVRRFMSAHPCEACGGKRLKAEILSITMPHKEKALSIQAFCEQSIEDAIEWLEGIDLPASAEVYATELLCEVRKRLRFLERVGLGYLSLDRESGSLSGGESQRIRLATQLGAGLAGVTYVLDEPSIGLHQADNERLLETLMELRDAGNSVIVVEHDEDTMRAADWLIDIGPGAGEHGGEVLAQGTPEDVVASSGAITGAFLSGQENIAIPGEREMNADRRHLSVRGARENNLQDVSVDIPLGQFVCVTGPSGSGKSTLVDTILRRVLARHFHNAKDQPGAHDSVEGMEALDKVIIIDQSPIGRSPRSNPATYVGLFNPIRELFAQLPTSRARGYGPGRFSFNVSGGRCETCQGDGMIRIDMHFLSDVYVKCDVCQGKRYNHETLDVSYRGKNISDVLDLTVDEALDFFQRHPKIRQKLAALRDVGLGYLRLGQPATHLSGGEAQRIKLAAELGKSATGKTLYLLDEPTTGLHFVDVKVLLDVLYRLRDQGNSLLVIEHHLDVIKCADWVVDLGPGGGKHGGHVVAEGPPVEIARHRDSATGRYLKRYFP